MKSVRGNLVTVAVVNSGAPGNKKPKEGSMILEEDKEKKEQERTRRDQILSPYLVRIVTTATFLVVGQ